MMGEDTGKSVGRLSLSFEVGAVKPMSSSSNLGKGNAVAVGLRARALPDGVQVLQVGACRCHRWDISALRLCVGTLLRVAHKALPVAQFTNT